MKIADASASRSGWLKTLHQWHWISSAISLLGMLAFAATGLTLNHAAQIETHATVVDRKAKVPASLLPARASSATDRRVAPLPARLADWVSATLGVDVSEQDAEWFADELYVSMPRPGGEAWVRIDRTNGEAEFEDTSRGWISYLNDLHKGRHAGTVWRWFIDLFAVACVVFSITGLLILKMRAGHRAGTWPLVGLGVVTPLLLAILFIH